MAIHSIELCAGVGMLGEGVRAGFEFYGVEHRTVCYVEREAFAASQLVTLMQAGALDTAPIWSDLTTFDGAAWRGKVDCVIAGFPCQDLSLAGRRAGLGGKRSGLFFEVLRVADDCGARLLVLENVRGITSARATVMDETQDIEERAASRVMGELADRGWDSEWIHVSASDVGANHRRERWFCLAWRELGNTGHLNGKRGQAERCQNSENGTPELSAAELGSGCEVVCNSDKQRDDWSRAPEQQAGSREFEDSGRGVGNPGLQYKHIQQRQDGAESSRASFGLFAPSPDDPGWVGIIRSGRVYQGHRTISDDETGSCPWAPATEPGVRMLSDGLALVVDESRSHQLRAVGNGVVPLSAAAALVELIQRSQIT